jgi:hypothetical protein
MPPTPDDFEQRRRQAERARATRRAVEGGPWYCWGCAACIRSPAEGVSVTGNSELQVCARCWEQLTVAQRVALNFLCRPTLCGGAGIVDASVSLVELLRALTQLTQSWRNRPGDDFGAEYDDS